MYSEKTTIFFEISILLMTVFTIVKSKVEISQNFVALSEYMNFTPFKETLFHLIWRDFLIGLCSQQSVLPERISLQIVKYIHVCCICNAYIAFWKIFFGKWFWSDTDMRFKNYVDKILAFFDHLFPSVDIFYLMKRWQKVGIFGLPRPLLI